MSADVEVGRTLDITDIAANWRRQGRRFAMATVAETWGSAPRPVGSHLIVDDSGHFEGSVSGGCVEGAVLTEAEDVIRDGKPRYLSFGVADETAWRVGLSCGGRISVLLQAMADAPGSAGNLVGAIAESRGNREPIALATNIETGQSSLHGPSRGMPSGALGVALGKRLAEGASGLVELPSGQFMITLYLPNPRLVLLGAVHISQELASMATAAGFEVVVIDPRSAFAEPKRLPGVQVLAAWPEEALPNIGIDRFTAFAALTHDPKIDDPGIEAALSAGCFYVGALGSRKTHERRLARLTELGIEESVLASIHAPIGLAIGARTPAEIAVAILAEIIQAKTNSARAKVEVAA
ncbi:MAG: XdhC family protein [Alphaproteobacteria bacterium]